MSIYIEKKDGTTFDLEALGIRAIDLNINSPAPRYAFEEVAGRDGHYDTGVTFEGRTIQASFELKALDKYDYLLLRDEVFAMFFNKELFYLIDVFQPKKRWLVRASAPFVPTARNNKVGKIDVEFKSPSPYAESYGTTLQPFTFDAELWQVGQGVISEDLIYAHNTTTFRIYNGSDIDIDPREIPLLIKYQGASTNLKIKNVTTGDEWAHTGTSGVNDTILLDGIRSLKNSLTIFGNTNRKLITLARGWNDFTLTGASGSFLISFDFRFHNI